MPPTNSSKRKKPAKPYPTFPLYAHTTGRWAKKIRGKIHYFGPWADPDGALQRYLVEKDFLHAGLTPRQASGSEGSLADLCNAFLNAKRKSVDAGELSERMWLDYQEAAKIACQEFRRDRLIVDIKPDDFAQLRASMVKRWGPHRVGNMIQYVRSIFKWGYDTELIDKPTRFGPGFARPSKKTIRLHKAAKGPRLLSAEETRSVLEIANPAMQAMILLGINGGFGNSDCAKLPLAAIVDGWLDFPRPKTGIARRFPLWPETLSTIQEYLEVRPQPKREADAGLLFITKYGSPWGSVGDCPISKEMKKLLATIGVDRQGVGFYALRHTFRTVADECRDQPAVDHIMGHDSGHISSHYRETISDARLQAVVDYVRRWLFAI